MRLAGTLLSLLFSVSVATAQSLREPVLAKIAQGETQRYVIEATSNPNRLLTISLHSLKR